MDTQRPSRPDRPRFVQESLTRARLVTRGATDNVVVVEYRWFCDGVRVATTAGTALPLVAIARAEARFAVAAVDHAGNVSRRSRELIVKAYGVKPPPGTGDVTAPAQPTGLVQSNLAPTSVTVSCNPSSDNVGVTGYQWHLNGVPLAPTTASPTRNLTGLTPNTSYTITVVAFDAAGNSSPTSPPLVVLTPTVAVPAWQTIQPQALTTGFSFSLNLSTFATDADSPTLTYSRVSGSLPTGVSDATLPLIQGTPTTVQTTVATYRASDGFNTADVTITFNVLNADTTAPGVPTGVAAVGVSTQQIDVSWNASTDTIVANARTSGILNYDIFRDGLLRVPGHTSTSYSDTGLAANTTHSYTVRARDVAGNVSAQSSAAQGTTHAASNALTVGAGKQYATIQAAINAAIAGAGRIIEVYNGNYAAFQTTGAGAAGDPFILRAAAGQAPVVNSGYLDVNFVGGSGNSNQALAHLLHQHWDAGQGIELRGTQAPGSTTLGAPERGYCQEVPNTVSRFKTRNMALSGMHVEGSVAGLYRYSGIDLEVTGTMLNAATGNDAGENFRPDDAHPGTALVEYSRFAEGGHGTWRPCFKFLRARRVFACNTRFATYNYPGFGTGRANHVVMFVESGVGGRAHVDDLIAVGGGLTIDNNNGAPTFRVARDNLTVRHALIGGNTYAAEASIGLLSSTGTGIPGATNFRMTHASIVNMAGATLDMTDNLGQTFGPFRFKNLLFHAVGQSTANGATFTIRLRYNSSRVTTNKANYWKTLLFMDGCRFPNNPTIVIQDAATTNTVATITRTMSQAQADFPDNFKNITVNTPANFPSTTLPPQGDTEQQAFDRCQANFLPGNSVAAQPLARLTATATNDTTFSVDDAQWFSDGLGFSEVPGDTIFIPGVGSRVISAVNYGTNRLTVTQSIPNAAVDTGVYLGSAIGRAGYV